MDFFDVVIIGAGPAGLKCAEVLGPSNLKILVLEKNSEIGPKVCAGGLTRKDLEYLELPLDLVDFKDQKIKLHFKKISSFLRDQKDFIYTVDRRNLGQWQFSQLKNFSNIKVQTKAPVSKIEKNFIIVEGKKIGYKFLVGADGSVFLVRKYLGLTSRQTGLAIQYLLPSSKFKELEVFFEPQLFSAWYAWIFPHKNYVSIGCGGNPVFFPVAKMVNNFKIWLKKNKIDVSSAKYEAFVLNSDYQGHQFKNIFLIGDAAGLVSPLTGEGIYSALVSGAEVAKIILSPNYKSKKIKSLIKKKQRHQQLMSFLIKSGRAKSIIFCLGIFLIKVPYFKKRAIKFIFSLAIFFILYYS